MNNTVDIDSKSSKDTDDKQEAHVNFINKLDHCCLAQILMYLPAMEKLQLESVCRKWKEALELSWCNVTKLVIDDPMLSSKKRKSFEKILDNCNQNLKNLTYNGPYLFIHDILKNKCQNIVHFSIQIDIFDDEDTYKNILQIISLMLKLKYFKIGLGVDPPKNLCARIFNEFPNNMEGIHVKLDDDTDYVLDLPDKFNSLHCLTLPKFRLTSSTIKTILSNKNTLVHLDLSKCKLPTDESLIFSNFINLEYLNLKEVNTLNVEAIIEIGRNCLKLKHFEFESIIDDNKNTWYNTSKKIPYHVFRELKNLVNLEYLDIYELAQRADDKDEKLTSYISNNRRLKYLKIHRRFHSVGEPNNFKEIVNFKYLQYLHLPWVNLDSQLLMDITSACTELRVFNIAFRAVSSSALESLGNLRKLEELTLSDSCTITDDVFTKIVSNCKNLVKLYMSSLKTLTEASLIHVGKLKYLEELDISWVENVPNAMFNDLYKLKKLNCEHCSSITDEGIIRVIDNCQYLAELNVFGTEVTYKTLCHKPSNRLRPEKLIIKTGILGKSSVRKRRTPHDIRVA